MAEEAVLNTVQCEFDSHLGHMLAPERIQELSAMYWEEQTQYIKPCYECGYPNDNPSWTSVFCWVCAELRKLEEYKDEWRDSAY